MEERIYEKIYVAEPDQVVAKCYLLIEQHEFKLAYNFLYVYLKNHEYNSYIYELLILIKYKKTYEELLAKPVSLKNNEYYLKIVELNDLKLIDKYQKVQIAYQEKHSKSKIAKPKTLEQLTLELEESLNNSDLIVTYKFNYFSHIVKDSRVYCLDQFKLWYEETLDNSKITIKNGILYYKDITEALIEFGKQEKAYYITFKSDYNDFCVYLTNKDIEKGLEMLTVILDKSNIGRTKKLNIFYQKEKEDKPSKYKSFKDAFKKLNIKKKKLLLKK